ncbi:hypothetical protein KVT40_001865 [Elsinoe batatas]|uniref:Major facilitator superfamily (MFS) profile domain-containing protein n=1 Tax=Elsinoe batatas TaxID=2601811 RepID=A0A8K0L9G9_9PEZI|nr:hypothetical protein KVT40_001865 [Elsinoe batatas]
MDPEVNNDERVRPQSITSPQLISVMVLWLLTGSCMSAVGVFIAPIKSQYELGDGRAATIFAASTCGYLAATATLGRVVARGWRTIASMVLFAALIGSVILSFGPPFPVVLFGYLVLMFGLGMGDSGFNIWASQMARPHVVQEFIHSSFSFGSVIGPSLAAFMLKYGWYCRRAWHLPAVRTCSVFFLFYVGSEAIFTDWGPEYARREKGASPTSSSLASSLFFRCKDLSVFYTVVFAVGFFLGPTFPSANLVLMRAIPADCTSHAVAIAVAVGQVGAAVTPLSLGSLSDQVGLAHLPDVSSTYSILIVGVWLILLSRQRGS